MTIPPRKTSVSLVLRDEENATSSPLAALSARDTANPVVLRVRIGIGKAHLFAAVVRELVGTGKP